MLKVTPHCVSQPPPRLGVRHHATRQIFIFSFMQHALPAHQTPCSHHFYYLFYFRILTYIYISASTGVKRIGPVPVVSDTPPTATIYDLEFSANTVYGMSPARYSSFIYSHRNQCPTLLNPLQLTDLPIKYVFVFLDRPSCTIRESLPHRLWDIYRLWGCSQYGKSMYM